MAGAENANADPNIQIKFALIFGLLAAAPLVFFFVYTFDSTGTESGARAGTNGPPEVRFTEITESSGLKFVHVNGAAGEKLLPETMGGGCAFFDFDNDGDQDILLVNSCAWPWATNKGVNATHGLYANDGKGSFRDVTAGSGLDFSSYGMGAAVGDYNGDGRTDVFITGVHDNRLMRNEGQGKFSDVTRESGLAAETNQWSTSAAFLDQDRDGDLDLFVCNYVQWSREIDLQVDYRLPGVGRAYGPPMNFAGTFPLMYRNNGNGTFTDISVEAGVRIKNPATGLPMAKSLGVAPVDLENDGWMDLVVANDTVQNFVFHNEKGKFTEMGGRSGLAYDKFGSTRGAMGIDSGRFHDDDTLAISIGNFANEMTALYVAQDQPLFFSDEALDLGIGAPTRTLLTFGIFFFDYDLDGFLDLLTANGHIEPEIAKVFPAQQYAQPAQLFHNSGNRRSGFQLVPAERAGSDLYEPMAGRGSAYADIDGDGDQDVLITQVNGPARLFRNEQKLGRNWMRVKVAGKAGNSGGIGARIRLRLGNRVLSHTVMPTRGYMSQSELPATFGLGSATEIDDAQVVWPDGTLTSGLRLKVNALNEVIQPVND